jgi:hypothetical protein
MTIVDEPANHANIANRQIRCRGEDGAVGFLTEAQRHEDEGCSIGKAL